MSGARLILAALAALLVLPARAQTPEAEQKPVEAFGADHPDCIEWTDGCIICLRQEGDSPSCSTVGAACLPAAPVCTKVRPRPM